MGGVKGEYREHLYAHFSEDGHRGLEDVIVMIIDKTDVSKPEEREGFWVYKINSLVPHGLNLNDFTSLEFLMNFKNCI